MADGSIEIRKGAAEPVEAVLQVAKGNLLIVTSGGVPTATIPKVTWKDKTGADITGYVNLNTSFFDTAASTQVKAQYILDTIPDIFVIDDIYTAVFTIYVKASADQKQRRELVTVEVKITDPLC